MTTSAKWARIMPITVIMLVILTSCGPETTSGGQQYKDGKEMVLDILKSEDGKKAIKSALNQDEGGGEGGSSGGGGSSDGSGGGSSGGGMKTLNTADTEKLKMTVKEVIANPENSKFLQSMMTDPKFAGDFAKAIKNENKQLHMQLIKDPDYQKDLLQVMKNQEFETIVTDALKSVKMRQQMRMVVQDTMQNPMFKAELVELLKKAVEENLKEAEKKEQKKEGGKEGEKDKAQDGGGGEGEDGEGGEGEGTG